MRPKRPDQRHVLVRRRACGQRERTPSKPLLGRRRQELDELEALDAAREGLVRG